MHDPQLNLHHPHVQQNERTDKHEQRTGQGGPCAVPHVCPSGARRGRPRAQPARPACKAKGERGANRCGKVRAVRQPRKLMRPIVKRRPRHVAAHGRRRTHRGARRYRQCNTSETRTDVLLDILEYAVERVARRGTQRVDRRQLDRTERLHKGGGQRNVTQHLQRRRLTELRRIDVRPKHAQHAVERVSRHICGALRTLDRRPQQCLQRLPSGPHGVGDGLRRSVKKRE